MRRLLLLAGLILLMKHSDGTAYKLVCYFASWAHTRPGPASVLPHDLDPFLCTHLVFAFASISNNQIVAKNLHDEKILYPEFNKLKERNTELKTLLSVGGWNSAHHGGDDYVGDKEAADDVLVVLQGLTAYISHAGAALISAAHLRYHRFTTMLSTFANREKFVDSVTSFLRTHGFDGLDLFFLYPGLRGSPTQDRWNFLFLIEELQFAFEKEALLTQQPRLLLSAAVSGIPSIIQTSYDVHLLGRRLDFINVLSYDLHGSWERLTGHNSPLFSIPEDSKSSAYAMNYWRKLGAPTDKLIMGFPTYGRTFHLLKASKNGLQAASVGPASPGNYTKQAGFLAYYEVCSFVQRAQRHWIDYQYVPYAYKGNEWLGYDDTISFSYKLTVTFIGNVREEGKFRGAMVWTLDTDDVRGTFCGNGPFPLVHILNDLLVKAEFNSTPLPKFWFTSSTNSSGPGSERLAVTEALTTDTIKILSPGGEAVVTEVHRKHENVTVIPSDGLLTPGETASSATHTAALESNTMAPGAKTITSLDLLSETITTGMTGTVQTQTNGGETMATVGHQSVTPAGMDMTLVYLPTMTPSEKATSRKKAVVLQKVTVPPKEMSDTPSGQRASLTWEGLTTEVATYSPDG